MLRQGTPRASRHGLDARLRVITPRLSTERSGWHHRLGEPSTSSLRAGLCTGAPCQNVFPQDRKGKQREISCSCLPRGDRGLSQDDIPYAPLQGRIASSIRPFQRRSATHLSPYLAQLRAFHASEPRRAIPLIPAGLGILKSTTLLAAATVVSRLLITFFPITTIATLRMFLGVRWLSSDAQKPVVSPEAEEFWKMWCEGERGIRPTNQEAEEMVKAEERPDGGITDPSGRVAYSLPLPPNVFRRKRDNALHPLEYAKARSQDDPKKIAKYLRRVWFFPPPLPDASKSYYEALSPEDQSGVDALRKYWISLREFKDNYRNGRWIVSIMVGLPLGLLLAVYVLGLERVPLTGRWRIILLTPEEETAISSTLEGGNWYKSVINLLTSEDKPAPPILPLEDWRWRWVADTLRRLETGVLDECRGQPPPRLPGVVRVPAAEYPIKPRPRMSWMLHSALPNSDITTELQQIEIGPPYSLLILQKDDRNAFSYGFGGKGAGGIVVYTGLLDDILKPDPTAEPPKPPPSPSFLSSLFSPQPPRRINQPTDIQTLHLASVLAHEMGHLVLSHHLETLSQQQVLWPSILGLSMDFARAFIWPVTWLLGPTVNDALANVGRTSASEMADRYGQIGFQWKHEYEADLAGLRILGLAGYDPRVALDHFSQSVAELSEIGSDKVKDSWTGALFRFWSNSSHPSPEQREEAMQKELERWEEESKKRAE